MNDIMLIRPSELEAASATDLLRHPREWEINLTKIRGCSTSVKFLDGPPTTKKVPFSWNSSSGPLSVLETMYSLFGCVFLPIIEVT